MLKVFNYKICCWTEEHGLLEELLGSIDYAAQRMWTSQLRLEDVPSKYNKEFCSILNEVIRGDDSGDLMANACVLVRAINQLVVMRRSGPSVRFPQGGVTYRGGALPV